MTPVSSSRIDKGVVETLLRKRHGREEPEECVDPECVAKALSRPDDASAQERASMHLCECTVCREALLALGSTTLVRPEGSKRSALGFMAKLRGDLLPHLSRPTYFGGLAAVAATLLVVVSVVTYKTLPDNKLATGAGLSLKGVPDTIAVAVQRGPKRFVARPLDQLEPNDHLGFFYTAATPGYLALFSVDARGRVVLIFPAKDTHSAAVDAASQAPLSDGAVVREGSGCEYLVGVFSRESLATAELKNTLEQTALEAGDCALDVHIPMARTTWVLPVRR